MNKRIKYFINSQSIIQPWLIAIILVTHSLSGAKAQDVRVSAHLDSNTILIGEQTLMHLTAYYNIQKGLVKITWPSISDSITSKVEVVSKTKIDTIIADSSHPEQLMQKQDILITCFDSGYYAIPPFRFIINGDTANAITTEPIMLTVHTVAVDTTKGIRDIKAPLSAPWSIYEILPWLGIGAAALALIALSIYFVRRRLKNKKIKPVIIKAPPVKPHVKALKALEELGNRKLWQEGKIKEYHTAVSDILRIYISERFGIAAVEMITTDIMQELRRTEVVNTPYYKKLQQGLFLADLVKFAKETPLPHEHEKSLADAIEFVNGTTIHLTPEPANPQPALKNNEQNITDNQNG